MPPLPPPRPQDAVSYVSRLLQGLAFAWQQAVGLPGGPHAAFKRYMADAATLRLVQRVRAADEMRSVPERTC